MQRTQSAEPKLRAAVSNSAPSLKVSTAARRSRTPDNKTRAAAAFIPGQARQIRVVNGRVEVEKVRMLPVHAMPSRARQPACEHAFKLGTGRF
jgi:hypothetical protein